MAWDYVIAGGGTAGAVMAARLTEDPAVRVLLLEAGHDVRAAAVPAGFRTRRTVDPDRDPPFWWSGLTARRHPGQERRRYLQGRGTGGSSTVNSLCAMRGVPDDYDQWGDGWSFGQVLPAFMALEDDHDFPGAPWHGSGGPIPVYRAPAEDWGGVDLALRDAALDAGYQWADDHNAPDASGISAFAMNIRDGRRVSVNDGYLEPARSRPNLTIRGCCPVTALTFGRGPRVTGRGPRVTGVRLADGRTAAVRAGGEVIVACGAAHSPALLLRSGIGPAGDLARLGIEVVADLPVGQRVQDHALLLLKLPTPSWARRSRDGRSANCVVRYTSGLNDAGVNDMMLLVNNGPELSHSWMIVQQQQVFSRGIATLASADPAVEPVIDLRILTDARDRERMLDGLERAAELLSRPAFRRILDGRPELPSRRDLPLDLVTSTEHLCGTCPMGAPGSGAHGSGAPGSDAPVVDSGCRVLGVEGLRVIDSSVIPVIPRANPHLTVIMLAEQMARRMSPGVHLPTIRSRSGS
jgi:5-(hydroxymethyl)furfural/furfural oxidase